MYRILIVEDDPAIAEALSSHLLAWDYEVKIAEDFQHITEEFVHYEPQLVLLDISLPAYDGYYWCTKIREISGVPLIFVSSADDRMSQVMAMNLGGDDFVEKPYDIQVLLAKIRALLRRAYSLSKQGNLLEHRGVILNAGEATILYNGEKTPLTRNELRILQTLMENAGKFVSRDRLMLQLWESDSFVDDNTLTVNMTRLRKKMSELGLEDFIETKKGVGYKV